MADAQHFNSLLAKIAEEQKFINYDIISKEISSGGANYTSKLFTIKIKDKENELNLFAKVAAVGEKMRSLANVFDTEIFAYTKLAKIYYQLQEDSKVADENRLIFPKFYGYNPEKLQETIVLEDLVAQGFSAYDRFKSVDWPYASSAIAELAKMHALSFAYGKRHPGEFQEIVDQYGFDPGTNSEGMVEYMKITLDKAVNITRQDNREKLRAYSVKFDADTMASYYKASKAPVLGHGDYRPSNLMHRKRDDGKIEIKIVDLQTLQGGSPVVDLLYFIFSGSDEQFRAAHYDQLIDHYYAQLSQAMRRLALDPDRMYSREDFDYELKEKLPFGLSIAVFLLPVVTVEVEHAPQVNEDMDILNFAEQKTSDLYAERLNGVVNDYVKWGILTSSSSASSSSSAYCCQCTLT